MRTFRRAMLTAGLAGLVVAGIAIGHTAGAATRTAAHTITVLGENFHGLDSRVSTQFITNTGGGVYAQIHGPDVPSHTYLEATPNLPVGAVVDQVTFLYRDCGSSAGGHPPLGHWYVFAYDPAHFANGSYILNMADSPTLSCQTTVGFVRPVSPAVKVAAGKVWALGVDSGFAVVGNDPITDPPDLLIAGAKVRDTGPPGC